MLVASETTTTTTTTTEDAVQELQTDNSYSIEFLERKRNSYSDETSFKYRITISKNCKTKFGKIFIGDLCSRELVLKSCSPSGKISVHFDSSSKKYGLYVQVGDHDFGSTKDYSFVLKGNVGIENSLPCHWFKHSDNSLFNRRYIKGPGCRCSVDDEKAQQCEDDGSLSCRPGYVKIGWVCVPSCFPMCRDNEYCGYGNKCYCKDGCKRDKDGHCKFDCGSDCKDSDNEVCVGPGRCVCKEGYQRAGDKCVPLCDKHKCDSECEECYSPNACRCKPGFEYSNTYKKCKPVCKKHPCKQNEQCTAPEKCECKPGYKRQGNDCVPVCDHCPADQICAAPGKCDCKPGFYMYNKKCLPKCTPDCPHNSICTAPNTCTCKPGFTMKNGQCIPTCDDVNEEVECGKCVCKDGYYRGREGNCKPFCLFCPSNSYCETPGKCKCRDGYAPQNGKCVKVCNPSCIDPNSFCNDDGRCECKCDFSLGNDGKCYPKNQCNCNPTTETCVNNKCVCKDGYERSNLFGICKPVCTCSGPNEQLPSTCTVPSNTCPCKEGWMRDSAGKCTIPICNCGQNQRCIAPNTCVCLQGYQWINNECKPECNPVCCDNEVCSAPNTCSCKPGFEKVDGVCVPVCSCTGPNEYCKSPGQCVCKPGYSKGPDGKCNVPICEDCDGVGEVCVSPGKCRCAQGYEWCEEKKQCTPKCNCGPHQICTAPNTCICEQGYIYDETWKKCVPKCDNCPPHSKCISPGHCKCDEGYQQNSQGQCIRICDCVRGTCDDGKCVCPPEYWGPRCENKLCTCFDFHNNDTRTCSTNGKCVDLDTCVCAPGWTGTRCHIPMCFGVPASQPDKVCNGHGICAGVNYCQCEVGWKGKYCDIPTDQTCPTGYAGIICSIPICNGTRADDPRVCSGRGICSAPNTCVCPYPYTGADCSCTETLPVCLPTTTVDIADDGDDSSNFECSGCGPDAGCCTDAVRRNGERVCYNHKTHSCSTNSATQQTTVCPYKHELCGVSCYNPILYSCDENTQTLHYITDLAERALRAQLYAMNSGSTLGISILLVFILGLLL